MRPPTRARRWGPLSAPPDGRLAKLAAAREPAPATHIFGILAAPVNEAGSVNLIASSLSDSGDGSRLNPLSARD